MGDMRKKVRTMRRPPLWMKVLEERCQSKYGSTLADKIRSEICQRGGQASIKKLHAWKERKNVFKFVAAQAAIESAYEKEYQANEHIVSIDDESDLLHCED